MDIRRIIFISVLCLVALPELVAQLISVRSQLERDSMMIGDQLVYTLHVETAANVEVEMPLIKETLSRNIEVLFPLSSDTAVLAGGKSVDQRYMITSFEPGIQVLPSQPVIYRTGDLIDTARSMPLMIRVFEPVVDTTQQIKPIKPPINTPLTFREALPWIALGLLGLLLAVTSYLLVKRFRLRRKYPEMFSLKPQEPAHVIAFRDLDRLKEEKLWEQGRIKQYYTRLTEITRHYIERQYGIPAMESTTEEILYSFGKSNTDDHLLDEMLRELLQLADLVKFAKEDPLPVDNQTNLNNAYLFVQKTYPLFYKEDYAHKAGEEDHE